MTHPPLDLTASLPPQLDLQASTATADTPAPTPDLSRRTITGTIAVWDQPGVASVGPCMFLAGSIAVPADARHVKLLLDHDHSRPVGYLVSTSLSATELQGTFYVPEGELGDLALAHARDGLRDALSPGAHVTDYSFDRHERVVVKASTLNEVSLVAIPAFAGARVSNVTAQHPTGDNVKRKLNTPGDASTAAAVTTGSPAAAAPSTADAPPAEVVVTAAAASGSTSGSTSSTSSPPASSPSTSSPSTDPLVVEAAHVERVVEAVREAVRSTTSTTDNPRRRGLDLRAMAEVTAQHIKRNGAAAMLPQVIEAALNDVTPTNISTTDYGPRRPQYVDDLWTLADVARPTIDAFGPPRELKSLKVHGWVWETRPEVARYNGNKAAVPSNQPKRVRQESTAQRFAGGWDVDRVFVDLPGDGDEVADIFTEATVSYKEQSEVYVAEQIAAAATLLYGAALSTPAALTTLGSYFGQITGARIGYIAMGSTAWEQFANMTSADAPWWLRNLGELSLSESTGEAAGLRFRLDPALPDTQILAADKRAARVWEVDPPVRVQALDIPNGGIDLGVFGYAAALVTEPRLVVNIDTAGRTQAP